MDWSTLFFGMLLGILLLPTLLMLGLRLLLWLLARKVRKVVAQMERGEVPQGFTVHTFHTSPQPDQPARVEILPTALPAESTLHERLCQAFLKKTSLTSQEWAEVRDDLLFVHDGLNSDDLLAMGFSAAAGTTAREQARGQRQLLGTLSEPVAADVYRR